MSGILFIIGTPIGNLSDLSSRARLCLADCDVIFAEDTRQTLKLINYLGLKKRLISYHEFNERQRLKTFASYAEQGVNIGLVCDAGMPLISDPGLPLVELAIQSGLTVVPVPGPSAFLLALIASGLPCKRFSFEGFLPDNKAQRKLRLEQLLHEDRTLVFYIAPHDLQSLISEMHSVFGPRRVCLGKEITKKHEQFIRTNLDLLIGKLQDLTVKGEFVLVVEGAASKNSEYSQEEIIDRLSGLMSGGVKLSEAAAQIAKVSGWTRSTIYKLGMNLQMQRPKPPEHL